MFAGPPRHVAGLPRLGRSLVMGVVNVTPDSFSDGGRWVDPDAALAHARRLVADGADIVDVGGESTRPGATRPRAQEEIDRVLPVVSRLAADGHPGVGRHDARRGGRGRAARGWAADQRRLGRPRGRRDVRGGGRGGGAVHPDALARALGHDAAAHRVRRRGGRRDARARRAAGPGRRGRHRAGADRPGPGHRVLQDRRAELGRAGRDRAVPRLWGTPCSSPRAASASSVPCSPPTTERCARPSSGTTAPPRPRRWPPRRSVVHPGAHPVRATVDAVRVAQRWAQGREAR